MPDLKLFMILLGCKPPGRHTEQHDFFFGIASSLKDLAPEMSVFWPEAETVHIDGWREVTCVDNYQVNVVLKSEDAGNQYSPGLFFINLGGYTRNKFEEQHYAILTVKEDKATAFAMAKETFFYKNTHFEGAVSHIDDKYGIDVDDLYGIEEILTASQKKFYRIELVPAIGLKEDPLHLGYIKLSTL